jgi:hypothetical protein
MGASIEPPAGEYRHSHRSEHQLLLKDCAPAGR